ncbi:hypothetical protein ACGFNU_22600 [Spirillospora sp. NPDC048911]|uniref:hypothetical protein n=1 Tax=Spirillospora sp. NPDC048911 TaxID=3364527 RepID=UPI00371F1AEC
MRVSGGKARTRAAVIGAGMLMWAMPAGPAAWADDLEIDPGTAHPGDSITVSGGCKDNDTFVSVSGAASGRGAVSTGYFSVQAKVKWIEPGRYTIIAKCVSSGYPQTGRIKIEHRGRKGTGSSGKPDGEVMTGGGGARDGAQSGTEGRGLPWLWLGLATVAGAAGAGGITRLRSRARGRT